MHFYNHRQSQPLSYISFINLEVYNLYPRSIYVLKKRFDRFGLLETLMAQ